METKVTDEVVMPPKRSLTKDPKIARKAQALLEKNVSFSLPELKSLFTKIAETGSYKQPNDIEIERVFYHLVDRI